MVKSDPIINRTITNIEINTFNALKLAISLKKKQCKFLFLIKASKNS